MRKAAALGLFALTAFASAEIRAAEYQAAASLQRPVPGTTDTEIDGVNWHCSGDQCVAKLVGRRSVTGSRMDECRKAAAVLGRLATFSSRGKELTGRDLDACNRSAR